MLLPTMLLTERVTVLSPTRASDGEGGETTTWAAAGTVRGVTAARASRLTLSEDTRAGLARDVELLQFYLNDADGIVSGADRLGLDDGRTYSVVQIDRQDKLVQVIGARV